MFIRALTRLQNPAIRKEKICNFLWVLDLIVNRCQSYIESAIAFRDITSVIVN